MPSRRFFTIFFHGSPRNRGGLRTSARDSELGEEIMDAQAFCPRTMRGYKFNLILISKNNIYNIIQGVAGHWGLEKVAC